MSWFTNKDLKPQGPYALSEMRNKVLRGEVAPGDLVLPEGSERWQMAIECREFEPALFPALQAVTQNTSLQEWVLLREVQEGPYSLRQIEEMLQTRQVTGGHYIWKTGLSGWVQIKDRPEMQRSREASSSENEI